MCKIGILAIGIDLYDSAFRRLQDRLGERDNDGGLVDRLDLAAHAVALLALALAFRGTINRQATGRVVFPVLATKAALELGEAFVGRQSFDLGLFFVFKGVLVVAKTLIFLLITAKLAFGDDRSYVAHDEWFPKGTGCHHGTPSPVRSAGGVPSREEEGEEEEEESAGSSSWEQFFVGVAACFGGAPHKHSC